PILCRKLQTELTSSPCLADTTNHENGYAAPTALSSDAASGDSRRATPVPCGLIPLLSPRSMFQFARGNSAVLSSKKRSRCRAPRVTCKCASLYENVISLPNFRGSSPCLADTTNHENGYAAPTALSSDAASGDSRRATPVPCG